MKLHQHIAITSLVFLLLLQSGCSKKETPAGAGLEGTWQWVRTDGGFGNHIHDTPASTGKNMELKIFAKNHYVLSTSGTVTAQGTFITEIRQCIHDHSNKKWIVFSSASFSDMMLESMDENNLHLSNEAYDGLGSLYSRK